MQSKRIALIVLPALLLGATTVAAQIPPPVPPLVVVAGLRVSKPQARHIFAAQSPRIAPTHC